MNSVWQNEKGRELFGALKESKKTDVLIIGGGITGVLCAYMLKRAGVDCILAEAKNICGGVTANTTAKITLQHGLIYDKLIKSFGTEKAKLYSEAQISAMKEFENLCKAIPCDYEKKDSYVYSVDNSRKIEKELAALSQIGIDADFSTADALPFKVVGAVRIKNQAQFHPLRFIFGIAEGLPIYENTKVTELMPGKALANGKEITYRKAIIATHFPVLNKHGGYFLKLHQHRSYVLALEGVGDVNGMYVDENKQGLSFRGYKNLLLLGGGAHRTGKKGGGWRELERVASEYYKDSRIVGKWATQDCMTLDSVPYIGQYSKRTKDLYVATGFNKWGMTSAMVSAKLLTDLVTEKENEYESVFSPSRSIMHPALVTNAIESAVGLLTPTVPRCPHLGCALKYNRDEHSWDCPCHGSRFTESGELINNPATDDKKNMP